MYSGQYFNIIAAIMEDADVVEADNEYRRGKQAMVQSLEKPLPFYLIDGETYQDLPRGPG